MTEATEIAQDVARKIIESYAEHGDLLPAEMVPSAKIVKKFKIASRSNCE